MKALRCDFCGANLVMDTSREFATCEFCGTKYMKETVQQKIQEIRGEVKISGAVETYKGDAEKERLIKNAETYLEMNEYEKAIMTYEKIVLQFPGEPQGWWGLFKSQMEKSFVKPTRFFFDDSEEIDTKSIKNAIQQGYETNKIKEYFDSLAKRYGNKLRIFQTDDKIYFSMYQPMNPIYVVDSLTKWFLFDSAATFEVYSDTFKTFLKEITDQYVKGIIDGSIVPTGPFRTPPYSGEGICYSIPKEKQRKISKKIAGSLFVKRISLAAGNFRYLSSYDSMLRTYANKSIDVSEILSVMGSWALVKTVAGENEVIRLRRDFTKDVR